MTQKPLRDLAHELRTPLTAILAAASSIQAQEELDPEIHAQFLQVIIDSARRLGEMIDDLESANPRS